MRSALAASVQMIRARHLASLVAVAVCCSALAHVEEQARDGISAPVPLADHHQHLFSPELAALMSSTPPAVAAQPRSAADLIRQLDRAGIKRAVVLSTAYIFEQPSRRADAAAEKLRRDNDWTSQQVAEFPDRLIGFCGLNPVKDYALDELARCARDPHLRRGLKLHFGNSVVDYHDPVHIEQVRRVFRAANDYRMTIAVHVRASVTQKLPFGRSEALIFLNELLPAAPDVVVQLAHLTGAGSWEDEGAQQAFAVFTEAVAHRDPRTRLLHFDVTGTGKPPPAETAGQWAALIRQLGTSRVVFGSDAAGATSTPGGAWLALRTLLPLTDEEFAAIATNVPPYMQEPSTSRRVSRP